jgi:hypothetical protein
MDSIHSFRYATTIPLCRFRDAATACISYTVLIYLIKHGMQSRKAFDLRSVLIFHNFLLSALSACLLFGFAAVLVEKSFQYSAWEMICSITFHEDGRLHLLYYLV